MNLEQHNAKSLRPNAAILECLPGIGQRIDLSKSQRKTKMGKYGSWRVVIKYLKDVHVPRRMEQQRVPGNVQSPCCSMGWRSCHIEKDNENDHWEGHKHWWKLRIDADGSRLGVELGDCIPGSHQIWNRKIPSYWLSWAVISRTVVHWGEREEGTAWGLNA